MAVFPLANSVPPGNPEAPGEGPAEAHYANWTLHIDGFALPFASADIVPNGFHWRDLEFSTDKYRNPPITLQMRIEESSTNQ